MSFGKCWMGNAMHLLWGDLDFSCSHLEHEVPKEPLKWQTVFFQAVFFNMNWQTVFEQLMQRYVCLCVQLLSNSFVTYYLWFICWTSVGCKRIKVWQGSCDEIFPYGQYGLRFLYHFFSHLAYGSSSKFFGNSPFSWSGEDISQMRHQHHCGLFLRFREIVSVSMNLWSMKMIILTLQGMFCLSLESVWCWHIAVL